MPAVLHEPWLALPLAGLVAAGFGILFGLPSIRARGEYLAIVTLALGEIVPALVIRFPDLTSGARGISGIDPPAIAGLPEGSPLHAYLLALAAGSRRLALLPRGWPAHGRVGPGPPSATTSWPPARSASTRRPSSWRRSRSGPGWRGWPGRSLPGWSATSSRSSST